jgi:hypothetical protein
VIGRLFSFAALSVLLWLLIALPARAAWGDATVLVSAVALLVCLVPAQATLAWVQWSWTRPVETQFTAGLGGTGGRLFGVVVITLLLDGAVPFLGENGFASWVILFYLLTLALEVGLLMWWWPTATAPAVPAKPTPVAETSAAPASPRAD